MTQPSDVLDYWFGEPPLKPRGKLWFMGGKTADLEIEQQFGAAVLAALDDQLHSWQHQARDALALIVLLDQFTRNLYRGSPQAFAGDAAALALCLSGIQSGFHQQLHVLEASFFFMPLEHAESMEMQDLCVQKFEELLKRSEPQCSDYIGDNLEYAHGHRKIIQQFSRYPHRNKVLERPSTTAELDYLKDGGATFGQ